MSGERHLQCGALGSVMRFMAHNYSRNAFILTQCVNCERIREQYTQLRSCDDTLRQFYGLAEPDLGENGLKKPQEQLFFENLWCVASTACPEPLTRWYDCLQREQSSGNISVCDVFKRSLERCLKSETQKLVRLSASDVFRPSV